jgi:hypothetical protein
MSGARRMMHVNECGRLVELFAWPALRVAIAREARVRLWSLALMLGFLSPVTPAPASEVTDTSADTGLEEITVTAEKYNSTIMDTPISRCRHRRWLKPGRSWSLFWSRDRNRREAVERADPDRERSVYGREAHASERCLYGLPDLAHRLGSVARRSLLPKRRRMHGSDSQRVEEHGQRRTQLFDRPVQRLQAHRPGVRILCRPDYRRVLFLRHQARRVYDRECTLEPGARRLDGGAVRR